MYIQIDKAGFNNKGAELMLNAVIERVGREPDLEPRFVFGRAPATDGQIHSLNLLRSSLCRKAGVRWDWLCPGAMLEKKGLIREDRVSVLLDASGFRFSDQFDFKRTFSTNARDEALYRSFKKQGAKVIFLPQAYGPFELPVALDRIRRVAAYADRFYAREPRSFDYLTAAIGRDKVRLAPDFTNLCPGEPMPDPVGETVRDGVAIIPNSQIERKMGKESGEKGFLLLKDIVASLLAKKERLVFVNHAAQDDLRIIERLCQETGAPRTIFHELPARQVKWILGQCKLVITSRFHGAVSGLSQCVPTVCLGWSHKYAELLNDYGCVQNLLTLENPAETLARIETLVQSGNLAEARSQLKPHAEKQKQLAEQMWLEVLAMIRSRSAT